MNKRVQPMATRVLLVEDDLEMRRLLAEALEAEGYEVEQAADGRAFLSLVRAASMRKHPLPDLVISDVRIPHISGLQVLEAIRTEDWALPVILITAFGGRNVHAEGERLGAEVVLDKPFELDDFLERVADTLPPWL